MFFTFRQTNPASDLHWQKITLMAFRWKVLKFLNFSNVQTSLLISTKYFLIGSDYLTRTGTDSSQRKSSGGWRLLLWSATKPLTASSRGSIWKVWVFHWKVRPRWEWKTWRGRVCSYDSKAQVGKSETVRKSISGDLANRLLLFYF